MNAVVAEEESYNAFQTNPLYIKGKERYLLSAKLNINKQRSNPLKYKHDYCYTLLCK